MNNSTLSVSAALSLLIGKELEGAGVEIVLHAPEPYPFAGLDLLSDGLHGADAVERVKHNPRHPRNNNGGHITRGGYGR
tara:strand:- start:464 stop:700 length:237 start_codon:yes stop_codon:yes gene_type:complete